MGWSKACTVGQPARFFGAWFGCTGPARRRAGFPARLGVDKSLGATPFRTRRGATTPRAESKDLKMKHIWIPPTNKAPLHVWAADLGAINPKPYTLNTNEVGACA